MKESKIKDEDVQRGLGFLAQYPAKKLPQLFIEGELYDPHGPFKETGWIDYEQREPGCIEGLLSALEFVVSNLQEPITAEKIKTLHRLCTKDVKKFSSMWSKPGDFRTVESVFFSLTGMNAHGNVITLLDLIKKDDYKYGYKNPQDKGLYPSVNVHFEQKANENKNRWIGPAVLVTWSDYPGYHVSELYDQPSLIELDARGQTSEDVLKQIEKNHDFLHMRNWGLHYKPPEWSPEEISEKVDQLMEGYYNSLKQQGAENTEEIVLMVQVIQTLARWHIFGFACGRVCSILLLNWLVLQRGLPPCTLYSPPADFFVCSQEIMVSRVKQAMRNSLQLIQDNTKNLFGFSTENIQDQRNEFLVKAERLLKTLQDKISGKNNLSELALTLSNEKFISLFELGELSKERGEIQDLGNLVISTCNFILMRYQVTKPKTDILRETRDGALVFSKGDGLTVDEQIFCLKRLVVRGLKEFGIPEHASKQDLKLALQKLVQVARNNELSSISSPVNMLRRSNENRKVPPLTQLVTLCISQSLCFKEHDFALWFLATSQKFEVNNSWYLSFRFFNGFAGLKNSLPLVLRLNMASVFGIQEFEKARLAALKVLEDISSDPKDEEAAAIIGKTIKTINDMCAELIFLELINSMGDAFNKITKLTEDNTRDFEKLLHRLKTLNKNIIQVIPAQDFEKTRLGTLEDLNDILSDLKDEDVKTIICETKETINNLVLSPEQMFLELQKSIVKAINELTKPEKDNTRNFDQLLHLLRSVGTKPKGCCIM